MHSKCQAGPGGESCTHGPACFHFLKPALILGHTTKEPCSAYKQHTGRVSEPHRDLGQPGQAGPWVLFPGSCRRWKAVRERRLESCPGEEEQDRGQVSVVEQAGRCNGMTPSSDHKFKFRADAQPPKLIAVTHEPDPGEQENGNTEDFTLCVMSAALVLEAGYLPTAPRGVNHPDLASYLPEGPLKLLVPSLQAATSAPVLWKKAGAGTHSLWLKTNSRMSFSGLIFCYGISKHQQNPHGGSVQFSLSVVSDSL